MRDVGVKEKYSGKKRKRCCMKFILIAEVKRGHLAVNPSLRSRLLVILDGPASGRQAEWIEHSRSTMKPDEHFSMFNWFRHALIRASRTIRLNISD